MHRILLLEFLQEKPVMKRIPASNWCKPRADGGFDRRRVIEVGQRPNHLKPPKR